MRLPARLRRPPTSLPEPDPLPAALAEPVVPPALRTPRAAAWWIIPAALLVGGAASAMAWWLLDSLPPLPKAAEEATARQGAIQTALALGAGIGAAITLMLAFRRQRHQEHAAHVTAYLTERNAQLAEQVAEHNRQDTIERRVTELYAKAVEQLGHDKAAVRLGGLYALERLAQDNPGHRQTIVNVICAYLRMSYTPPGIAAPGSHSPGPWDNEAAPAGQGVGEDELQVRLTAQRILAEHLCDDRTPQEPATAPATRRFWEGMRIDLTGATLIDLDFRHCHTTDARFTKATFHGNAEFSGVTFHGAAGFRGAIFSREAWFDSVTFLGAAGFNGTIFRREAGFDNVTFHRAAGFNGTTFSREAWFDNVTFHGAAGFNRVTFSRHAGFSRATFSREAWFTKATFYGDVRFNEAIFHEDAKFGEVTFYGAAWFGEVIFHRTIRFSRVTFRGTAWFDSVTFHGDAKFGGATFHRDAEFDAARVPQLDNRYDWPLGWMVIRQPDGSGLLHRDDPKSSPPSAPSEER